MNEDLDKIKGAVAAGLSQKEAEALLGRALTEDEANEFVKIKAQFKIKAAIDKQKPASRQPALQLVSAGITPNLKPKLPPLKDRYTKEQIETCIEKHYGVVTRICNELDCTYSQFYKAVKSFGLDQMLADAKKNLVSLAEQTLFEAL